MTQKVKESGQGKHLGMLIVGEDGRNNINRGTMIVLYSQWQEESAFGEI